jgi:putative flippase GtrA
MFNGIKGLIQKHRQFLLYSIVGAANTLITWTVFYVLNKRLGMNEIAVSVLAYGAGIINGFIWSTRAVFKTKGTVTNFTKFIAVNILMIGLNAVLVGVFHNQLGIDSFLCQIMATPFTFIGNFVLNKFWTFMPRKNETT